MTASSVMKSSEYAPFTRVSASAMRSSTAISLLAATRWTNTSVSVSLWKIDPRASSSARSSSPLVRLPLWQTASDPRA